MEGIVRIIGEDGQSIGTGFYISSNGDIATCYHVISEHPEFQLRLRNGEELYGRLDTAISIPEYDLAVLRTDSTTDHAMKISLHYNEGDRISASGYQYQDDNIIEAFPTTGEISGKTMIRFGEAVMPVITIQDAVIDHGISGGPLKLLSNGSVIGVVSMKILEHGGGAIAFKDAAEKNENFRAFLESIEQPIYGDGMNYAGACAVLRDHTTSMLKILRENRKYLPDMFVPREGSDIYIDELLKDETRALVVSGGSGVGKTNLVASLAEELQRDNPVLLIPFYRLQPSSGFRKTIYEQMKITGGSKLPSEDKFDVLFDRFDGKGRRPILILEGINETQTGESFVIDNFFEDLRGFIEKHKLKLIISSRPEFFSRVSPESILSSVSGASMYRVDLKDYSPPELRIALKRYGVNTSVIHHPLLNHPFYLRLAWETASNEFAGKLSALSLVKKYLDLRFAAVDRLVNRVPQVHYYYSRMDQLAVGMIRRNDLTIPHQDIYNSFTAMEMQQLVSENVFVQEEQGTRFNFDVVAEYFIARSMGGGEYNSANTSRDEHIQDHALHFFASIHETKNPTLVANVLRHMSVLKDISLFRKSLSVLENPEAYKELLVQTVKSVMAQRNSRAQSFYYLKNRRECIYMARQLPIWRETRMAVIRLLSVDKSLERDVSIHQPPDAFRNFYGLRAREFFDLIDFVTNRDPSLLIEMIGWGRNPNDEEAYQAYEHLEPFIYHFRSRNFEGVVNTLYTLNLQPKWLEGIFMHDGNRLFAHLSTLTPSTSGEEQFILHVCQFYLNTRHHQQVIAIVGNILSSSTSQGARAGALSLLIRSNVPHDGYRALIAEFRNGNQEIQIPDLLRFLHHQPSEVLDILEKMAYSSRTISLNVFDHLLRYALTDRTSAFVAEFFVRLYHNGFHRSHSASDDYFSSLCQMLRECPTTYPGFDSMFELAITILEDPSVDGERLLSFFTDFRNDPIDLVWLKLSVAVPFFEDQAQERLSSRRELNYAHRFRDIIHTAPFDIALPFAQIFAQLTEDETLCRTIFYSSMDCRFYWDLKVLLIENPNHELFQACPLLAKAMRREVMLYDEDEWGRNVVDPERHLTDED